ncbi:MAG: hypothetical protein ACRDKX_00165 [Solirubrobacterales bacterium]
MPQQSHQRLRLRAQLRDGRPHFIHTADLGRRGVLDAAGRPALHPDLLLRTFPWPQPTESVRDEIADLARRLVDRRQAICVERGIGLTDFYNLLDEGAWREVVDLHRDLDRAVARAYGWPAAVAEDRLEIRARLAKLHAEVISGEAEYRPFVSLVASALRRALDELPGDVPVVVSVRGDGEVEATGAQLSGSELTGGPAGPRSIPIEDVQRISTVIRSEGPE